MNPEYLSIKELVEEYGKAWKKYLDEHSAEAEEQKNKLKLEIIRRLEEPWRRLRDK